MSNLLELQDVNRRFQRTDAGVVPVDWDVRAVKEMGQVITGKALAVNGPGRQRPYLRTKNVYDGRIETSDVLTMPMTDEQFAQFRVEPGDVLLNEGQSIELVGRCALYSGEYPEPCAIQNQLLRFRARDGVSGRFASYLFRYAQQTGVFARIALQTTSIAHLGGSRFERLRLAWPRSEQEQIAIASALGDVDALIGSLDRLIAKKRDLKQAAMQQLLTGKTRLPGFKDAWAQRRFCEVAAPRKQRVDPRRCGVHQFCVELEHIESGTGRLTGSTSTTESSSLKSVFQEGDVLFGKLRAYLRKYWLAGRSGVCSTEIWVLAPIVNVITSSYLFQIITLDDFIDAASTAYGTHMPRSDWNVVKNYTLTLPPAPEQAAIAEVLMDMDAELAALKQRRDKTRLLKQGMMQELLTGRIRLT